MPSAVGTALVAAQHSDRLEADLGVRPDRRFVVGGRVNRQALVTVVAEQVAAQRPDGVGADAPALHRRIDIDVDRRMAVVGVILRRPGATITGADRFVPLRPDPAGHRLTSLLKEFSRRPHHRFSDGANTSRDGSRANSRSAR